MTECVNTSAADTFKRNLRKLDREAGEPPSKEIVAWLDCHSKRPSAGASTIDGWRNGEGHIPRDFEKFIQVIYCLWITAKSRRRRRSQSTPVMGGEKLEVPNWIKPVHTPQGVRTSAHFTHRIPQPMEWPIAREADWRRLWNATRDERRQDRAATVTRQAEVRPSVPPSAALSEAALPTAVVPDDDQPPTRPPTTPDPAPRDDDPAPRDDVSTLPDADIGTTAGHRRIRLRYAVPAALLVVLIVALGFWSFTGDADARYSPSNGGQVCEEVAAPLSSVATGNGVTTCPFAERVRDSYRADPRDRVVYAYSPARGQQFRMYCATTGELVRCDGGDDAVVVIY